MSQANLESILASLKSSGTSQLPISETADQVDMLAATQVKKLKKGDDLKKLTAWVARAYSQCDGARAAERRQWYKNLDMYQGRQFTVWSNTQSKMVEPVAPDFEPRLAVNIIEPVVRTEMAKTGSKHPKAVVSPASNDDEDIMAALAGQDVWDWFYDEERFQTNVFNPSNFFRTVCGNGFIKIFHDDAATDEAATAAAQRAADEAADDAAEQAASQNVTDMFPVKRGKVPPVKGKLRAESVTPFHLLVPDLAEPNIQKQGYVLHTYTIPLEKAKLAYKDFVDADWSPATVSASAIMNVAHLGIKGGNAATNDSVQVIEAWVKPGYTGLLPDGGLVVTVGGEIVGLANQGIPYDHGDFPFAHLTGIDTGRFYRKSIVESITNIQNELNRTYAQIIKQKNLNSKPQFYYDEGSVDPKRITSKAGQYIPVRLGMSRPTAVPIVPLANYVLELMTRLSSTMDDITGQHQISRAQGPGANTAASALSFLRETDDNFLYTTFDAIEAAMETVARQFLSLAVQFWDEPRMVHIAGNDHAADARTLKGSDIANGTNLRIEGGSALPESKAARIATVTDWIKAGIVDKAAGLEAMEMGTLGKVYDRIRLDRDAAKRENLDIRDLDESLIEQWNQIQQDQAQQAQNAQFQAEQAPSMFGHLVDPAMGLQGGHPSDQMPPAPQPAPLPATPPIPLVGSGPEATTQPGAVAPPLPGVLQGAAVPTPRPEQPPIFFPINWHDNDQVHMEEHRNYANSQSYRNLSDVKKKVYEDHYYAHLNRSLALQAIGNERQTAMAVQESAELAQQAPTVRQTARVGGKNQFAGEQFSTQ